MSDSGDPQYFSGWTIAWVVMVFLTGSCWNYLIREVPASRSWIGRVMLLLAFAGLLFLTLLCFSLTLCVTPYTDFGFSFSIFLPSVVFWLSLAILAFGFVQTSFLIVQHRTRSRVFGALRRFLPYQLAFIGLHLAYASAFSCPIGVFLCTLIVGLYAFEATATGGSAAVHERRQRAKWE